MQQLNGLGLSISKRQVLRLLSNDVDAFCDEAHVVLRASHQDYVINAEALAYMRERYLVSAVIEQLDGYVQKVFANETVWSHHLDRKQYLLCVLDRPKIPFHTNASESDIRCHVTKRKISGGTRSEAGRDIHNGFHSLTISDIASTLKALPPSRRCQTS